MPNPRNDGESGPRAAAPEPTRSERLLRLLLGKSAKAELPREQSMSSQRSSIGWADWNEARVVTKDSGTVNNDPDASPSPPFVDPERLSPSQMPVVVRAALRLRHMAKGARQAICSSPRIFIIPVLLFAVMTTLGVWAVVYASADYVQTQQENALGFARGAALGMTTQFELALNPCAALEACVVAQPRFNELNQSWVRIGSRLFSKPVSGGTVQLELAPYGKILSLYPFNPGDDQVMGYNTIGPDARPSDVTSVTRAMTERSVVINFKQLIEGGYGAVIYYPVFINDVAENETFGLDFEPTPCEGCVFYNATTRTKWWGTVIAVILLDPLLVLGSDSRLAVLLNKGYDYKLMLPPAGGLVGSAAAAAASGDALQTFASSTAEFTAEPVRVTVDMPDGQVWVLEIAPQDPRGWQPTWRVGLIVMVVLLSVLVGVLVFVVMLSNLQYRDLVWNMMPKNVVRALQLGQNYAEPFSKVTILFSDIVSYTNLSSEMTPSQLVDLLNRVYSHYDGLCEKHGVFKVETIGDAFVAVAGCPNRYPAPEAARRVAALALDMMDFIDGFVNPDGRRIRIRLGLFSGDITAAVVGTKMKRMTMIGDTVNVASRMESNSAPQKCHIGEPTARLLAGFPEFQLVSRGLIDVKGKGQLETFWLSRATALKSGGSGRESPASVTPAPGSPRGCSAAQMSRPLVSSQDPAYSPLPTLLASQLLPSTRPSSFPASSPLPIMQGAHGNAALPPAPPSNLGKVVLSMSPLGDKPQQSAAVLVREGDEDEQGKGGKGEALQASRLCPTPTSSRSAAQ